MKKLFNTVVVAFLSLSLFGLSSCKVDDQTRVNNIASVLRLGTELAVAKAVLDRPELAPHFAVVPVAVKAAVDADALTPEEVVSIVDGYLDGSGADTNTRALVHLGVSLSLTTYQTFYTNNGGVGVKPHLKTLLNAISDGVTAGLNTGSVSGLSVGDVPPNPLEKLTDEDLTLNKD